MPALLYVPKDESIGKDPSIVQKTENFDLPIKILRSGNIKADIRFPVVHTSGHAFHPISFMPMQMNGEKTLGYDIRTFRLFFLHDHQETGTDRRTSSKELGLCWEHVTIAVTCENQEMADKRLPVYLSLPLFHHSVMIEPMLTAVDLRPYIDGYRSSDGSPVIKRVSVGGESVPEPGSVIIPG